MNSLAITEHLCITEHLLWLTGMQTKSQELMCPCKPERGSGSLERALGKGGYHQTVASAGSTGFSAWENSEFNVPNI